MKTTPEEASRNSIPTLRSPMRIPASKFLPQCMDPSQISIGIDFNQQDFGVIDWTDINAIRSKYTVDPNEIRIEIDFNQPEFGQIN